MNTTQLEAHITRCGELMAMSMSKYEATSCLLDRADADRYRIAMDIAIRARIPGTVAKMEQDRGLS
jgi:hypothetical protein